jgi:hypothetical protein
MNARQQVKEKSLVELIGECYHLNILDQTRLSIARMTGKIINAGITTWVYEDGCLRYTEQIRHSTLSRFPDDSYPYEVLMGDLDDFEMNSEEPIKSMLWFYLDKNGVMTFNAFKRSL